MNSKMQRADIAAEQWGRERPDVDAFPMQLLGRLSEVAQIIESDRLIPFFRRHGPKRGDFDVLATLRHVM